MNSLQPLNVDFAVEHFAVLPSPNSFFGQSAFNQLPPAAAFAVETLPNNDYYSDSSVHSPEPSLDSTQTHSSRSTSPASSFALSPSPKLETNHLASQAQHGLPQYHYQQQYLQQPAPLSNASVLSQGAQAHYQSQDYKVRATESQHLRQGAAQFAQMAAPMVQPFQQQLFQDYSYNGPQPTYHQPQPQPRPLDRSAQATFFQDQFSRGAQFAAPAPAPYIAAPSFETPQGTFYFVPNVASVAPTSAGVPVVASGFPLPLPTLTSQTRSESASSLDAEVSAPKVLKKTGKKGKNTSKRFICPHEGCGRGFARNFNMQSHLKSHLGIRDFSCPHCPKLFSRRHDRARHCAAVHDDVTVSARAGSSHHEDEDDDQFDG